MCICLFVEGFAMFLQAVTCVYRMGKVKEMTITPKNITHPQNDESVEQILGFNNNLLTRFLLIGIFPPTDTQPGMVCRIEQAMTHLFFLQVQDTELCQTTSSREIMRLFPLNNSSPKDR